MGTPRRSAMSTSAPSEGRLRPRSTSDTNPLVSGHPSSRLGHAEIASAGADQRAEVPRELRVGLPQCPP